MSTTAHSRERIDHRTAHTVEEVRRMVAELSIPINRQPDGRTRRLFYAPLDGAYFIAIVASDGAIVTVMPAEWASRGVPCEAAVMARRMHVGATDPAASRAMLPPPMNGAGRRVRLRLGLVDAQESHVLGYWPHDVVDAGALGADAAFVAWVRERVVALEIELLAARTIVVDIRWRGRFAHVGDRATFFA